MLRSRPVAVFILSVVIHPCALGSGQIGLARDVYGAEIIVVRALQRRIYRATALRHGILCNVFSGGAYDGVALRRGIYSGRAASRLLHRALRRHTIRG